MSVLLNGLNAMLPIVIMVVIGYLLTTKGRLGPQSADFLAWFAVNVALPCSIFSTVVKNFDLSEAARIPMYIIYPLIAILLGLLLGVVLVRIFHVDSKLAGAIITLTACNNTIMIGLPVNVALLGEEVVPFVLYYYLVNTTIFWTIGVAAIQKSGSRPQKFRLSKLVSPTLWGMIFGILLLVGQNHVDWKLPDFVMSTINFISGTATPLSMLFIGHVLGSIGFKSIRIDRNITLGLIARLVLAPAISVAIFLLAPIPVMMKKSFIIQSFMPVMAVQSVVARQCGANAEYPAVMVALSSLVSVLLLPLVNAGLALIL